MRVFEAGPGGVLRFSGDAYVSAGRYGDVVLWHYAFARHWFKINLTTSLAGQIVETGGDEPGSRFAVNCDIATPMLSTAGPGHRSTDLDGSRRASPRPWHRSRRFRAADRVVGGHGRWHRPGCLVDWRAPRLSA